MIDGSRAHLSRRKIGSDRSSSPRTWLALGFARNRSRVSVVVNKNTGSIGRHIIHQTFSSLSRHPPPLPVCFSDPYLLLLRYGGRAMAVAVTAVASRSARGARRASETKFLFILAFLFFFSSDGRNIISILSARNSCFPWRAPCGAHYRTADMYHRKRTPGIGNGAPPS